MECWENVGPSFNLGVDWSVSWAHICCFEGENATVKINT